MVNKGGKNQDSVGETGNELILIYRYKTRNLIAR